MADSPVPCSAGRTARPYRRNPVAGYLNGLLKYRHLCWNLVGSDVRARFRRSRLGILWAIIQPLSFSLMIALVWGALFEQSFLNFAVYVFSGMVVWEYFTNVVLGSQDSLIGSEGYLKQARIPLIVFQARTPLSGFVTFLAGLVGLGGMLIALGQFPQLGPQLLLVPAFMLVLVVFLFPIAIIFSLLGTQFRDLRHASAISINALFFMSPVMIAREYLESEKLQFLHYVNPIIPLLDMMRAPVLDSTWWSMQDIVVMGSWIGGLWILALVLSFRFGRRIVFSL